MITTAVWGTGNVGRAAIRAVHANPRLQLSAVVVHDHAKVGRDAGDLGGRRRRHGRVGHRRRRGGPRVPARRGRVRGVRRHPPDDALADIMRILRTGAVVVTPSVYALYDHRSAPPEVRQPVLDAIGAAGGSLFVSGVDPGWGNDVLPLLLSGLGSVVDVLRCQEIFDYSTYDQPDSVRYLVGMGQPMDYEPPMIAPSVPTMVWGGQIG